MADSGISNIKGYAIAIGALAVVTLLGIAIVGGFKDSGALGNCSNSSATEYSTGLCNEADYFITGLAIFGTFVGVIILAIIGKIIVGLYKGS